jgi:hypothetical protein
LYGLKPTDVDALAHLRQTELAQICVGPHDIQFNFHPRGNISVWGRCELIDAAGKVVDVWEESTRAGSFRFPELLKSIVQDIAIDSPKSFVLRFANGLTLRVVDSLEKHESVAVADLIV